MRGGERGERRREERRQRTEEERRRDRREETGEEMRGEETEERIASIISHLTYLAVLENLFLPFSKVLNEATDNCIPFLLNAL